MTGMTDALHITSSKGICEIRLNRPSVHNAFDDGLIAELTKALESANRDASVWGVVLSGEGSTFSAGADLNWMKRASQFTEAQNLDDARKFAGMLRTLAQIRQDIIDIERLPEIAWTTDIAGTVTRAPSIDSVTDSPWAAGVPASLPLIANIQ